MRYGLVSTTVLAFQSSSSKSPAAARRPFASPLPSSTAGDDASEPLPSSSSSSISNSNSNNSSSNKNDDRTDFGDAQEDLLRVESLEALLAELETEEGLVGNTDQNNNNDNNNNQNNNNSNSNSNNNNNNNTIPIDELDEWLALLDDRDLRLLQDDNEDDHNHDCINHELGAAIIPDNRNSRRLSNTEDIFSLFPDLPQNTVEATDPRPTDLPSQKTPSPQPSSPTAQSTPEPSNPSVAASPWPRIQRVSSPAELLEMALKQEVVPAEAGVGSNCLPGDYGFDPLQLSKRDYPLQVQRTLLSWLPEKEQTQNGSTASTVIDDDDDDDRYDSESSRPPALILRDYREAEIRHGRLAMLAAVIWPLQEMLDRLLLDDDQYGPLVYGPATLPFFPLFMTLLMMLLGYLDIYSQAIKDRDEIGEAFLPGDCFWDPLSILQGAPPSMKRNMQERELFNGRVAMLAVAAFFFEEVTTHLSLIAIEGNELLLEPAYTVPFIQEWLDARFSPSFETPSVILGNAVVGGILDSIML